MVWVESDGRSIFFTQENGTSSLPFYIDYFDFSSQEAILYVQLPSLPTGDTSIFCTSVMPTIVLPAIPIRPYCITRILKTGTSVIGPMFLPGGTVQAASDGGNGVLLKTTNSDPNGGYVNLPSAVTDFECIWRTNRINTSGGAANRYAVEDASENGYGPSITNFGATVTLVIEERTGGSATTLTTDGSPPSLSDNTWYILLMRRYGSTIDLELYDESWTAIDSFSSSDATVTSFSRFAVRGGYEFWTDDIRLRAYNASDPHRRLWFS